MESPTTQDLLSAAVESLGGAPRAGQQQMADAVADAMADEMHLAVQAGTGTGKSLAYLVPAIRHAQATGTTVIVSTATIALQKQLVDRDLPRLADALEPLLTRRPTFAIMKGRGNYVCLNKLAAPEAQDQALIEEADLSWLGKHVKRVHEWADETDTGDRDSLEPGVPDQAWKQVSVSARECIGATRCQYGEECFAELARRRTKDVDVIVTNHALLAIDALADVDILPDHEVVIVDEAHELDGRITAVATNELGLTALKLASKRVEKLEVDTKLADVAEEWSLAMTGVDEGRLTEMPDELDAPLTALQKELFTCREHVKKAPDGEEAQNPTQYAERLALASHLLELHDSIARIREALDKEQPDDVVWASYDDRRGATLNVAPLSVAGLLATRLFGENTVILTSATLTIGGNFNAMAATWGLPRGTWRSLDAGTPFDPAKSAILYTPRHLPVPGRDGIGQEYFDEIHDLIMATGGRTLGLFSSRRAAEAAAKDLRARLPFEIYCQGDDNTGALVDKFAKNENSCLFGTLSLWQGVDVPGTACTLVIMDKIPFPRPDDPLLQARKEAADAEGRNGFMEVAATHAALLMAQGAGRLQRRVTDKGVVAVLDRRIVEKRYGTFLLNSLPAMWRTDSKDTVTAALKRLVASDV